MSEHSYTIWLEDREQPWDPHQPGDLPIADCAYLGGVFREFERHWSGGPLSFLVTKDTTSLPRYGDDVVVVLLNEEWFRTPAYGGCVRAVLRNLPGRPWFPWGTLAPPSLAGAFAAANHARVLAERRRAHRGSARVRMQRGWPAPTAENTIDIPLGYYRQPEQPIKPFQERGTDVYFGGSLIHDLNRKAPWKQLLKRVLGNPKQLYRTSMLREFDRFRDRRPELRAKVSVSGEFRDLASEQVSSYANDMMDARIALVPRGTVAESYRLFEAWRYGCVVICEPLPPRPFLQGAPLIVVHSWRELDRALGALLDDPERQRELHEASLGWWRNVCSEAAVGRRLAVQLSALSGPPLPAGGRLLEHREGLLDHAPL